MWGVVSSVCGCTAAVPEPRRCGCGWLADVTALDPGWILQPWYTDIRTVYVRVIAGEPVRKMKR